MTRPDSIRQTASMARCVSVAVAATYHTIFNPLVQACWRGDWVFIAIHLRERSYDLGAKSSGPKI
jgi:hypothetical protein